VIAEAQLSAAPSGRTACFILDLGFTNAEAAVAVAHELAQRMLGHMEALLADPATDLPAQLRAGLAALADPLAEQSSERVTVTMLDTSRAPAWRAHPAGRRRR